MVAQALEPAPLFYDESNESPLLSREQLVDRIMCLNPSATNNRLAGFEAPALRLYLEHLTMAMAPRGESYGWMRPGDTAAILTREARDE